MAEQTRQRMDERSIASYQRHKELQKHYEEALSSLIGHPEAANQKPKTMEETDKEADSGSTSSSVQVITPQERPSVERKEEEKEGKEQIRSPSAEIFARLEQERNLREAQQNNERVHLERGDLLKVAATKAGRERKLDQVRQWKYYVATSDSDNAEGPASAAGSATAAASQPTDSISSVANRKSRRRKREQQLSSRFLESSEDESETEEVPPRRKSARLCKAPVVKQRPLQSNSDGSTKAAEPKIGSTSTQKGHVVMKAAGTNTQKMDTGGSKQKNVTQAEPVFFSRWQFGKWF